MNTIKEKLQKYQEQPDFLIEKFWYFNFHKKENLKDVVFTDRTYNNYIQRHTIEGFLDNLSLLQAKSHNFYFYANSDLETFTANDNFLNSLKGENWFWYKFFFAEGIDDEIILSFIKKIQDKKDKIQAGFLKYVSLSNVNNRLIQHKQLVVENNIPLFLIPIVEGSDYLLLSDKIFKRNLEKQLDLVNHFVVKVEFNLNFAEEKNYQWFKTSYKETTIEKLENVKKNIILGNWNLFNLIESFMQSFFPWRLYDSGLFQLLANENDTNFQDREKINDKLVSDFLKYMKRFIWAEGIQLTPIFDLSLWNLFTFFSQFNLDILNGLPKNIMDISSQKIEQDQLKNLFLIKENFFNIFDATKNYHIFDKYVYLINLNSVLDDEKKPINQIEILEDEKEIYYIDRVFDIIEYNILKENDLPYIPTLFTFYTHSEEKEKEYRLYINLIVGEMLTTLKERL